MNVLLQSVVYGVKLLAGAGLIVAGLLGLFIARGDFIWMPISLLIAVVGLFLLHTPMTHSPLPRPPRRR